MKWIPHLRTGILICAVSGLLLACALTGALPSSAAPTRGIGPGSASSINLSQTPLPFEGLWVSQDSNQVIVLSGESFYWLQVGNWNSSDHDIHEEFADILSYDLAQGHLRVNTQWVRGNGQMVGFDAPTCDLTYVLDGNTLRINDGTIQVN